MKKILTILLALLILAGCGEKAVTWEDIKGEYEQLKQDVVAITENTETYLTADYLSNVEELKSLLEGLDKTDEEANVENLQKVYKLTCYIETISSEFTGNGATKINNLAKIVDTLIQTYYDGTQEDFDATKQEVIEKLNDLDNLTEKDWADIERKELLKWEDVEADYEALTKEAKADLTDPKEITESELEAYKNDILEKYAEIQYGVTVFNEDAAKDIYKDAVILEYYARKTTSTEGKKVKYFALDTKSYVKQCYGKVLDESEELEQEYALDIEDASKWTQSVWNVITAELKI